MTNERIVIGIQWWLLRLPAVSKNVAIMVFAVFRLFIFRQRRVFHSQTQKDDIWIDCFLGLYYIEIADVLSFWMRSCELMKKKNKILTMYMYLYTRLWNNSTLLYTRNLIKKINLEINLGENMTHLVEQDIFHWMKSILTFLSYLTIFIIKIKSWKKH